VALILLRHGESTANVAREDAERARLEQIPVECREADVPLSDLGSLQARAAGLYLRGVVADPDRLLVWSSPYRRARQTAELAISAAGLDVAVSSDERLRDRELGVLDTLTSHGVRARFPEEAARRAWLGKFYYRPPGGESWADVALRLRGILPVLKQPDTDVCVFTHDAVIAVCRYVLEAMDERTVLDLAAREPLGNASITKFSDGARAGQGWTVDVYNDQRHLVASDGSDLRTTHPGERDVQPH
jgi:broad specificity phosphatase PhoE